MNRVVTLLCFIAIGFAGPGAAQDTSAPDAHLVLEKRCGSCHQMLNSGSLSRIGELRKTPEGWDRTIQRMMLWHGVEVSDDERAALVKFLADTRGLAPSEAKPYRYAIEKQPDAIESEADAELAVACARCHSFAHLALQRRTPDEWERLIHTHVGQWPTLEYQDKSRGMRWWELAFSSWHGKLAARFPFESAAWNEWQRQPRWSPAGEWQILGWWPGRGRVAGILRVRGDGRDRFRSEIELTGERGETHRGGGSAILYSGYEWRGQSEWGGEEVREVLALENEGERFVGRWYFSRTDSLGGPLTGERLRGDGPRVSALLPAAIRAGERQTFTVIGTELPAEGAISLGRDITVTEIMDRGENMIRLVAEANIEAAPGKRTISIGGVTHDDALLLYKKISALRIEPKMAIARVGGGSIAEAPAAFRVFASAPGPDGIAGSRDDLEVGEVPVTWQVEDWGEPEREMQDAKFAGEMDEFGIFHPAPAGPNPKRPFKTNNAGRLRVIAVHGQDEQSVRGEAELVVTVQRWVDPIIR